MSEGQKSTQYLTMEMSESTGGVSFGKRNGCYVKKGVALILGGLFVCSIVATGGTGGTGGDTVSAALRSELPSRTGKESTNASISVEDVLLPSTLKPIHYRVRLQPLIRGNFSIIGYVEVEVEVIKKTSVFTLHMVDIIAHNDTVKVVEASNRNGKGMTIMKQTYDKQREFFQAHLHHPLKKGRRYVMSMHFMGYLNEDLQGFYRSSYKDSTGKKKWVAVTQFQPTDARRAFPCFDEPALKATFEIFLARETDMIAISNMPKKISHDIEGQPGWVWDHFNTSVPMSTYLVAFLVADFKSMETVTKNGVKYSVWAREEALHQANYSLEIGASILTFFEDFFNISFPLPKQDMVALTDFSAGAMENWGLITYRETDMLYDPILSDAFNKQRVTTTVAHELAHQWFGNLVTPKWWTDLWLNEGFASYMSYLGADHAEPHWQMKEQFLLIELHSVFRLDCLESSHPIIIPVGHPDEIVEIFDTISYSKGASIIRMMRFFLTEETFRKGLNNYLMTRAYDSAEQDDLWDLLTNAGREDSTLPQGVTVKEIMDTWTLQMGYPVVKVVRSADGTSATATQERFLLQPSTKSDQVYKWWIPLSFTTQRNPDFTRTAPSHWISKNETKITIQSLPDKSQWVIFNVQQTGYYRVNYEVSNWKLLIQQLKTNHTTIHVNNRAQLLDDALNLARAGQLSYSLVMDLIDYLKSETSYTSWATALNNINYIHIPFSRTGVYGAFKNFMVSRIEAIYQSVGFNDSKTDPHLDQFKRVKILSWACELGYRDCVDNSVSLYKQWMMNPKNNSIVSPNLKDVVYCTAIAAGGETEWEFAWSQYITSNVASEKSRLLDALGCTKKVWILSRYLEMAFDKNSGIRKQDAKDVFSAVAMNTVGRDLAWNYLREHWLNIIDYMAGTFSVHTIINSASNGMNKDLQLKELKQFQSENLHNLGNTKRAVAQAIERTANNIEWMTKNSKTIIKWLEDNGFTSTLRSA